MKKFSLVIALAFLMVSVTAFTPVSIGISNVEHAELVYADNSGAYRLLFTLANESNTIYYISNSNTTWTTLTTDRNKPTGTSGTNNTDFDAVYVPSLSRIYYTYGNDTGGGTAPDELLTQYVSTVDNSVSAVVIDETLGFGATTLSAYLTIDETNGFIYTAGISNWNTGECQKYYLSNYTQIYQNNCASGFSIYHYGGSIIILNSSFHALSISGGSFGANQGNHSYIVMYSNNGTVAYSRALYNETTDELKSSMFLRSGVIWDLYTTETGGVWSTKRDYDTSTTTTVKSEKLMDTYQNAYHTVYYLTNTTTLNIYSMCALTFENQPCVMELISEVTVTPQPTIQFMKIEDKAQCFFGCFGASLVNADWIEVTYTVNDLNINTTGNCSATDEDGTNYNLTYDNPSNPFNTEGVYSNNLVASVEKVISVTCQYQTYNITSLFEVGDTDKWGLYLDATAGYKNTYNDEVSTIQQPISFKTSVIYNPDMELTACYLTFQDSIYNGMNLKGIFETTNGTGYEWLYDYQNNVNSAGLHYYQTECFAVNQTPRIFATTLAEKRQLNVKDTCNGVYADSKLTLIPFTVNTNYGNYSENDWFYGQIVSYMQKYEYYNNLNARYETVPIEAQSCAYVLNYANGTYLNSGSLNKSTIGLGFELTNPDGTYLAVENYTLTASCKTLLSNLCIQPQNATVNFTVLAGAGCLATLNSCGVTSCSVCNGSVTVCESGVNVTLPPICFQQECRTTTEVGGRGILPDECWLYDITVETDNPLNTYGCVPDADLTITATLYNRSRKIDANLLGAFCTLKINKRNPFNPLYDLNVPLEYDAGSKTMKYKLENYINTLECDNDYQADVVCSSQYFTLGDRGAYVWFDVGNRAFCDDGTIASSCKYQRTGDEYDKPVYCNERLELGNNSVVCGCPPNMRVNATSLECTGLSSPMGINIRGIVKWLVNNWWFFGLLLVAVALIFKTQRLEQTVIHKKG